MSDEALLDSYGPMRSMCINAQRKAQKLVDKVGRHTPFMARVGAEAAGPDAPHSESFTKVGKAGEEEGAVGFDDADADAADDMERPYSPVLSPMGALHDISKEAVGKLS